MDEGTIKGVANATAEFAKTSGKLIDSISEIGSAFAKFFGPASNEVAGMIADHLKYNRFERQVRMYDRSVEVMHQRGLTAPASRCRQVSESTGERINEITAHHALKVSYAWAESLT